jgi:hypothetical protein
MRNPAHSSTQLHTATHNCILQYKNRQRQTQQEKRKKKKVHPSFAGVTSTNTHSLANKENESLNRHIVWFRTFWVFTVVAMNMLCSGM